jgi:hypothetical protein
MGVRSGSGPLIMCVVAGVVAAATAAVPTLSARAASPQVLMVVADPGARTAAENVVVQRLTLTGYGVRVVDDNAVVAADASGAAFALLSQSIAANATVASALRDASLAVWVAKPTLFDDFGLTGSAVSEYGSKAASTVSVTSPGHPMAAGRTGTVPFQNGRSVSWGRPPASATVVARAGTDATIFAVEPGAVLADGRTAPGCRLTFPLYTNGPTVLTADGLALFDAAAAWAERNCLAGPPVDDPPEVALTAPTAGATLAGAVTLRATATDDGGVASVAFAVDGAEQGTDVDGSNGWNTPWDTTLVADGDHVVSVTATDSAGQTDTAEVGVRVDNTNPPRRVLFVVANPQATTEAERLVQTRLLTNGYEVAWADDNTVTTAATTDRSFVLVSQSVGETPAVKGLRNIAVPVWLAKPYLFDDFGVTGTKAGTDFGSQPVGTVQIVTPGHPMAAGLTGTVSFQSGRTVSWGKPPSSATVVARSGTAAMIFTLPLGAPLATGQPAAGCRLTFPLYTTAPAVLTANGWAMFDSAATWAAGGCSGPPPPPPPPPPPDGEVTHVVQVSVDGFNPDAIAALGPSGAPHLHALIADGASTLDARTAVEVTRTLPNHTSMLTARTVLGAGGHQVSFNEDDGRTVHAAAGEYVASAFDVVHDAGLRTAFYAGSTKFAFLDRTWNATNGAPDTIGADDGRDKIDTYLKDSGDVTTAALVAQLTSPTPATFSFLHLAAPDAAGHASGFMGTEYLQAVSQVDGLIGQVRAAIESDPDLAGHTVLIVTADHGGRGLEHADPTSIDNYRIPLLVWGSGVGVGADLYALNPDRAHPGTTRPGYGDVPPPLRNGETANLVTDLLGLPPVPGSTLDVDQSLDLAAP